MTKGQFKLFLMLIGFKQISSNIWIKDKLKVHIHSFDSKAKILYIDQLINAHEFKDFDLIKESLENLYEAYNS